MARDQLSADVRLWRHLVTIIEANLSAALAGVPAGVKATAPDAEHYFIATGERWVRKHRANAAVSVYVYPVGKRKWIKRHTQSNVLGGVHTERDWAIGVKVLSDTGAEPFVETWKTLEPDEREAERLAYVLGAVEDVMTEFALSADDCHGAAFVESGYDVDFGGSALGGKTVWKITQIVSVPVQVT